MALRVIHVALYTNTSSYKIIKGISVNFLSKRVRALHLG